MDKKQTLDSGTLLEHSFNWPRSKTLQAETKLQLKIKVTC